MSKSKSKLDGQARAILLREWNTRVRKLPPAARLVWLDSVTGLVAHGANQRKQLVAELRALRKKLHDRCCSESWMDLRWHGGERYRGKGMRRARVAVRYGEDIPRRRATPAPAVDLEDEVDGLSYAQAEFYDRPASPSAVAIRRIGLMRGRELSSEELERRAARRLERRRKLVGQPNLSKNEILESIEDTAKTGQIGE